MAENQEKSPSSKKDAAPAKDAVSERTPDDALLDKEREALKKAQDAEVLNASSSDGSEAHGNLHFGDQETGEFNSGVRTRDGGGQNPALGDGDNDAEGASRTDANARSGANDGNDPLTNDVIGADGANGDASAGGANGQAAPQSAPASESSPATGKQDGATASAGVAKASAGEPVNNDPARTPVNEAPTDIALSDNVVSENDIGAVVANLSTTDPDADDSATYSITEDASGLFEVVGNELRLREGVSVDHEAQDSYEITLQVEDSVGNVYTETVTINVADINEGPSDIALSGAIVNENASGAIVAALTSTDPDAGDTATYSITEDASGLFEVVGNELKLKDGVSLDHEAQDSYDITLQVEDSAGSVYTETVTINVADINETPTDIALSGNTVNENDAGASVATLSSTDPDSGETAAYTIKDDPSGLFEIVGNELKLKDGVSLDHEGQETYELTLSVEDRAGNEYSETVTINVADLNEGPGSLTLSNTAINENAPGAVVGTVSAVDPDDGDVLTFTVSDDRFEVVGNEVKVKDGVSFDHESIDAIELTVSATDQAGQSTSQSYTIAIEDLNEGPTDISLSGDTLNENSAGATIATLSATDEDAGDTATFSISEDASGLFEVVGNELKLKDGVSLDHEAQDSYEISLTVEDSGGAVYTETVTINVADLNEGPTDISLSGDTQNENSAGATIATLSATDEDAGDTAAFAISEDASGLFEVVGNELKLKDGVSLDHEAQDSYEISLSVEDSGGAVYTETVTINVADLNEGPTDIQLSNDSISEGDAGGVVGTLTAFDPDAGDTLAFTVSDDRFEVVGNELKLKDGVELDFEETQSIDVTVTATDAAGASTSQSFEIGVDNVNEGPSLGLATGSGLQASYFNVGHSLSNLDQVDFDATPDAVGVVDSLDYLGGYESFWEGAPNDYFAAQYEGKLVVETGGTYTFNMASDDGSVLFINGQPVLDNDGLHGTRTRSVTLELDEGAHDIEVRYFENGGAQTLQLTWSGPDTGGVNEVVGGDSFIHGFDADALTVAEDEPGATIAELSVSDPDAGDTHTFTVDDDRFEVVEDDGAYILKLKDGVSLDHETETDVDVSVTVTDAAGASDTVAYSVAVDNSNTAPEIDLVGGEGLQASYYNVGLSLQNLDQVDFDAQPDAEGVVSSLDYTQGNEAFWEGAPNDFFAAQYEGQLMVDEGGSYTFSLASDDGSMLFIDGVAVLDNDGLHSTRTRTVTLELDEGAHDIEVRYFENGGSQTLQLAWSGPDTGGEQEVIGGDSFRLPGFTDEDGLGLSENVDGDIAAVLSITDAEGDAISYTVDDDRFELVETDDGIALKLKDGETVDHETSSEITVTVTATDEHGESASQEFSIPVADVNEGPTDIAFSGSSVNENDAGATVATLTATDQDAGDTASFSISEDASGLFEVVGNELKLKDGVSLDHEGQDSYEITVQVEDLQGAAYTETVTIDVADVNEGPTDIALSATSVNENDAGATVATLSAADQDAGDTASFSISEDASGLFEVVGNELKLKDGVSLDHEGQDSYEITLQVEDGDGAVYTETVTIDVADVNEAPVDFVLEPTSESGTLSLNQDGGNDDAAIAANMEGFPTTALTVEVTFSSSQTDVGNGVPLFSYAADGGSNNEALIWLESGSGNVQIYLAGQRIDTGFSNADLLDGAEHQVSFSWDQATNEIKFYVDGEEEFSSSVNIRDLRADGTVAFGQEQDSEGGSFDTDQIFEGEISEARIFDYARSAEEIADNAGEPLSGPEAQTGLVSNWVMNADDGGFIRDIAGNNDLQLVNDATVEGGPSYDEPTVVENDAGAVVGTLSATDPDSGEPIANFAITDDASGFFEVVGNELKLKDGVSLDHEAQESFEVTIEAIDEGGASTTQTVTINVADVGEAPIDMVFDPATENGVLSLNQDGGNDDYAVASNIEGFPTDAITVEVSFVSSQTDVGDGVPLFSYAADGGSDNEALVWLEGSSGNVHVFLAGQKINTGIPNASLLDGEPHQVSFSWDQATNELKVYVDGEQEFSTNIDIRDLQADGTLVLGQEQDAEGGRFDTEQVFEGQISDVRIFDYARSDQEIADNADQPLADPGSESGLVSNWVMSEEQDGRIEDLAGDNDLELRGDADIVDSDVGSAPTVNENEAGAVIGTISATDPQTGEAVTEFVIADDPSGLFELDGDQLKLKDGESLDFETATAHDVVIEAIGAGGETTTHMVTVNVADIDETNLILGTEGNDRLNGGDSQDEIHGLGGNDRINSGAGDDVIDGGDGRDTIRAGDGDDVVDGGSGRDNIAGGEGADTIDGGDGNDVIRGDAGDDKIDGGDGNDNIAGGDGADELRGGDGNDVIYADGDDTVVDGGAGADRVIVQGDGDFSTRHDRIRR